MDELKKAVKACGTICGICNRELGEKYNMADIDNARRRPFFGVQQAIRKLNANHLDTEAVNIEIASAMNDIDPELSTKYFDTVISMELQGIFGLAYSRGCFFRH